MAPTRAGWMLLGASLGLLVGARLLGRTELTVLGLAAIALVAGALVWVATRKPDIGARRVLAPPRPSVGMQARVEVVVANQAAAPTSILNVTDLFDDGRRAARFLLAPLPHDERATGAYRLPTVRRGRYRLGPLTVSIPDPFGLAIASYPVLGAEDVLIIPRLVPLLPIAALSRADRGGTPTRGKAGVQADEFMMLREYVIGDELRRVHWRSSARTGSLKVRQDESQHHPGATVLLDTYAGAHSSDTFEAAVEAAASLCALVQQSGADAELLTSGGERTSGLRAALDLLAIVKPSPSDALLDTARALTQRARARPLVVVIGETPDVDVATLAALGTRTGFVGIVATRPVREVQITHTSLVVDASGGDLTDAWNEGVNTWTASASSRGSRSRR